MHGNAPTEGTVAEWVDANLFDLPDGSKVAVLALPRAGAVGTVMVEVTLAKSAGTIESLQVGRDAKWTPVKTVPDVKVI